ncbi:RNA-guided endonuclease InsQ/TnpB family protein [Micromonospora echinofusca]|uniref:RNA-guided endonuclease InsQ/TnpB family protein n=1 Tax=Micromonospora echinofusca TaxID=47858 RepID=UPI001AD6C13C|nr:zinc ribbon domain-containing protein [Micromonospora echinofusca]
MPLQQTLRHLQAGFTHFFAKRARYPTFKSRKKPRRSAEYTTSAFRWRDGRLTLAKMTDPLDIVWSRPLPDRTTPSTVTVSQDAAGRQVRTMLEYKADWYGRTLVAVDHWFPSSKLCSACGALAQRMPLTVRTRTCRCGQTHDRDVNAARNILAAGLAVTACGAGVRPQRGNLRTGQQAMKQENPGATTGVPVL